MKQKILSVALALCLFISFLSVAPAWQEVLSSQEEVFAEESTSGLAARDSGDIPTPAEVYESMMALKEEDEYKEGTTWTDYEPYSDTKGYYRWHGGTLGGSNIVAVGCVAFAFILSDAAFGSLPASMFAAGDFEYEDIKVGDILRVNGDTHTVIVLEVDDAGVIVAEGNNNGKVHWGRAISKADVMKSTSHYITRYPEGYIPPNDPTANDVVKEGDFGTGLSWKLTKAGTLTISGNGAMPDFDGPAEQPWYEYSSQIRKVIIEDGITSIGSCAFWNCGILSMSLPSSVTTIGNSAFRGSSIISVTIPSSVKTIGDSAFRECENLCSVIVSEGVETIVQNAFRVCSSLTSIDLPASIEEVGSGAFFQCEALISVTFEPGSKQVKLGDNLFTGCRYLMSVTLPQSIDRIGEGMFLNCLLLPGVIISQGAESIGTQAFASSGVQAVAIPDSVTTIGSAAFSVCPLTDIYYTGTEAQWKSVSKIGDTATLVSKVTMHYNYVLPTPSPTPTPTPTPGSDPTKEPNQTADPGSTTGPDQTQGPDSTKAPDQTQAPDSTKAPDQTDDDIADVIPTKLGDVDGDGYITLTDAYMALKAAMHATELNEGQEWAADVDGEEGISLSDVQIILRMALKITQ